MGVPAKVVMMQPSQEQKVVHLLASAPYEAVIRENQYNFLLGKYYRYQDFKCSIYGNQNL